MFRRLLPLAFALSVIVSLVMASLPKPPPLPGHPGDKLQHVLAFATMAALGAAAWPRARLWPLGLALSAFGVLIEIVQLIPSLHRDSDVRDWLADTVAIAAVLGLIAAGRHMAHRASRASSS